MAEKTMSPHSSTLAWKIPWMEEPGRLQSMGSLRVDTTERLHSHFSLSYIEEGNGNPLQCSCLQNPRDGGAWWAAVYGLHKVGHDWSDLAAAAAAAAECNGTPLQYSCLENPTDGGAWWAAIHGFAKSRARLKRLSSSSSSRVVNRVSEDNGKLQSHKR